MKREDKTIQDQAAVSNATSTEELKAGARGVAIAMYCVLLVSYILMAADRYLFPVLAPDVRKAFGFSLANTGLLSTIFTLGLGLGGLPTGYLLARYSRKMVLLTGIVIFSSATALTTQVPGFWTMLVCLAAQGIGMSMLATCMFALAASYFASYRAAAIGSVNTCYGIGGFAGPIIAGKLRQAYNWRVPMASFGLFGFVIAAFIAATVRSWFSEARQTAGTRSASGGATSLGNRNTVILTVLSIIHGLSMYGFLGLYPTFLRETLHYSPADAGKVIAFFGLGALLGSIGGGWIGDMFSPKVVLSGSLLSVVILGFVFFRESPSMLTREILTCIYGGTGSGILYVNLAGYHVKALRTDLSSRGSGMFVTSLYGGAAFGGYVLGFLVGHTGGWLAASEIEMSLLCLIGAVLALALRPGEMSL